MNGLNHNQSRLKDKPLSGVYLVLDNIRSAENVGAIFRTCDAVGVIEVYLCGITPRPPRRDIAKAALSANEATDWQYNEDIILLIKDLKSRRINIVALEQTDSSNDYLDIKYTDNVAIVIGNEVEGIKTEILELSDQIIEIPMLGRGKSLNVATATGILLYSLL